MRILVKAFLGDGVGIALEEPNSHIVRSILLMPEVARGVADLIHAAADQVEFSGGASSDVAAQCALLQKAASEVS